MESHDRQADPLPAFAGTCFAGMTAGDGADTIARASQSPREPPMPATNPRVLVFQHIAIEHPGVFRDFLREDGIEWTAVELDEGEPIPALDAYDALWVMGGPMDVWEGRRLPLAGARARRDPGGGHRAQDAVLRLLSRSPASRAGARRRGRAGGRARDRHHGGGADEAGRASPDLRRPAGGPLLPSVAWRGSVAGAARRANPRRVPGLRGAGAGLRRPRLQHPVPHRDHRRHGAQMGEVPAYEQALEHAMGEGALAAFEARAAAGMADLNRSARCIYDNFMRIVRQGRA